MKSSSANPSKLSAAITISPILPIGWLDSNTLSGSDEISFTQSITGKFQPGQDDVFAGRKDEVFKQLKALLEPFNITRYYTDDWGAYERPLGNHRTSSWQAKYPENRT